MLIRRAVVRWVPQGSSIQGRLGGGDWLKLDRESLDQKPESAKSRNSTYNMT